MRYYPGVSPAIPHTRAGWSRVTHPFAGYPELPPDPRDLHVLSTPPAFVLSQDQTLQENSISSDDRTAVSRCRVDSASESLNCTGLELCSSGPCRPASYFEFASHILIPLSIVKQRQFLLAVTFPRQPSIILNSSLSVKGSSAVHKRSA